MTKQAMKRRSFIKKAGVGTAAAAATATLGAPYVKAQKQIKWRLQTYAGPALAEHVIKPPNTDTSTGAAIESSSLCTASIVPFCMARNSSPVGTSWSAV